MATACFCGLPSLLRRAILSLIFCFFERRIPIFLATTHPVPVVTRRGRHTSPEPSSQLQGGLLPV